MKHISISVFIAILIISNSCTDSGSSSSNNAKIKHYSTYQEALADNNFKEAYAIVDSWEEDNQEKKKWEDELFGDDLFVEKRHKKSRLDIDKAKAEIYNKEVNYLAVQGTTEANKRLLVLINEEPIEGVDRSEGQEITKHADYYYTTMKNLHYLDKDYSDYVEWCHKFNSKCLQIIEMAITTDNKELADMMIKTIKKDPEITTKPTKGDKDYYDIYAHYTNKTKKEAIAKYEEHFGKFDGKFEIEEEYITPIQDNDYSNDNSHKKTKSKHKRRK